jgi:hypothetical protein
MVCLSYFANAQNKTIKVDTASSPPKASYIVAGNPVPSINLKEIPLYNGKYVSLTGTVYEHRLLDTLEVLALGGTYPNQALTVIIHGKALNTFKTIDIDGKTVWVSGIIRANGENKDAEMFINNSYLISIIPKH